MMADIWHVVQYQSPDRAVEIVLPTSYQRARDMAEVLANAIGEELVVERVGAF